MDHGNRSTANNQPVISEGGRAGGRRGGGARRDGSLLPSLPPCMRGAAALPSVPLVLFTTPVTAHWSASERAASRRKAKQAKAATAPTQEGRSQCRDGNGGSPRSRARAPPSVGRSSIPRRAYPACFARLSNSDSCPPPSLISACQIVLSPHKSRRLRHGRRDSIRGFRAV